MNYKQKISQTFTVARVFALISIVSAHIHFPESAPDALEKIYSIISSIGVITFLFISGYFFNPEKFKSFSCLVHAKLKSVGIPWLFLGSISYLYNTILSGKNLGFVKWGGWIVGHNTYLYYLTILMVCFSIFYKAGRKFCYACILINWASLSITAAGCMTIAIEEFGITNYLNPLNWVGFFAMGQLCRSIGEEELYRFMGKYRLLFIAVFVVASTLVYALNIGTGYFSYAGVYLEILGMLCILCISTIKVFNNPLFVAISNNSFAIYLLHMMVIGITDRVYNLSVVTQAFSAVLVIGIAHLGLALLRVMIQKLGIEWSAPSLCTNQ